MATKADVIDCYLTAELGRIIGIEHLCLACHDSIAAAILRRPDKERARLAQCLSEYRGNTVWQRLEECPRWELKCVPASRITVCPVNQKVNPVLERHSYRLAGIADDPETSHLDEFNRVPPENIPDASLIGIESGDDVKLIDGIHRAIVRAIRGTKEFEVYVGSKENS